MTNTEVDLSNYEYYFRTSRRDHLMENGETLCKYNVQNPSEDDVKALDELTEQTWTLLKNGFADLCNECGGYASSLGLFDHDMGKEDVDFECPECGDVADKIAFERGMVNVWHYREPEPGASVLDGKDICRFNFEPMEEWRRGESKGSLEGHDD